MHQKLDNFMTDQARRGKLIKLCLMSWLTLTPLIHLGEEPPSSTGVGVSAVNLLANAKRYDNKRIQVRGWLSVSQDEHGEFTFILWFNREAFDYRNSLEAVMLDSASLAALLPEKRQYWSDFHGEMIFVQGTFKVRPEDSLSEFAGTLKAINHCQQLKPGTPIYPKRQ